MLRDLASYLAYLERIRERTLAVLDAIPADRFDWAPRAGEYTLGDIARHIASAEQMNVTAALGGGWHYVGHRAEDWGGTLAETRAALVRVHAESVACTKTAGDAILSARRTDLTGNTLSAWRILMGLIEHEIHHRSQLDSYLMLLGVEPPQLFGVKMEALPRD